MPGFLGMESHIANDRTSNLPTLAEGRQAAIREGAYDNHSTTAHARGRLVPWQVAQLHPHPSYARLGISISSSKLNVLLELGEDAFLVPLLVTSSGYVIDGYARLEVARLQGRATVECIEYDISEEEALRRLLLCHRPTPGLPPFTRIAMARGLTKSFKEKAFQHQQAGGRGKGSSKLTETERVDVRKEVASIAGVSVGTLSHALDVLRMGDSEILQALCSGEIKIDRAWRWCKEPHSCQRENLRLYRRNRGMERVAEKLIARQIRNLRLRPARQSRWAPATSAEVVRRLTSLPPETLGATNIVFIKAPLPILALSEDLGRSLGLGEGVPACS
jgi:ParB-like chromosome segregation protein Spo0J